MRATVLPEPELEFHAGSRHVDPRHGVTDYGPADASADSPRMIRVGVVGTQQAIEGVRRWLDACRRPIAGKDTDLGNLFFPFPGFDRSVGYRSTLIFDSRLERRLRDRDLAALPDLKPPDAVRAAVDLYRAELDVLNEEPACDVILVARPDALAEGAYLPSGGSDRLRPRFADFHATLKAEALRYSRPLQLLRRSTWDPGFKAKPGQRRSTQDPATRAWNLHTALYYKAGGVPWRLPRSSGDLTTCFVGIAFFRADDPGDSVRTSLAQVFNQRGDGMIVRGGPAHVSHDDRQPHLNADDARQLLADSMQRYRQEHRTLPARVVLHKSSAYTSAEVEGFTVAAEDLGLDQLELLWVGADDALKLFRPGLHPPLRGTMLSLDESFHTLYTRGSVPFYRTYPGMYVPDPLAVRMVNCVSSPEALCAEVLALTKMNWNQTQLDTRMPITLKTARMVGEILKRLPDGIAPQSRYAFYM